VLRLALPAIAVAGASRAIGFFGRRVVARQTAQVASRHLAFQSRMFPALTKAFPREAAAQAAEYAALHVGLPTTSMAVEAIGTSAVLTSQVVPFVQRSIEIGPYQAFRERALELTEWTARQRVIHLMRQ